MASGLFGVRFGIWLVVCFRVRFEDWFGFQVKVWIVFGERFSV